MNNYLNTSLDLQSRVNDLISHLTLDEKIGLLPTEEAAVERLNIKKYNIGGEAAHGVVTTLGPTTVFPQPMGLSSTWDADLLYKIGSVMGIEARAYYKKDNCESGLTRWAPTIDMERDPRWGRTEEAYGEDPCLTGKLSSALVKGMQGDDNFYLKMVPAPKHFYANNVEQGRTWISSQVTERDKHEYYLKAFRPTFTKAHAGSLMTAYNKINGIPGMLNPEIKSIVKDKWGCDGFVVCDGAAMSLVVNHHNYFKTHAETIAAALKAGVDAFTDDPQLVISSTKEALSRKLITEKDIDKALFNIFKIRFRLGQFDPDEINPYSTISEDSVCSKENCETALKAAREAVVLLKNDHHTLPLNRNNIKSIAVIGPLADYLPKGWYAGNAPYKVTALDGIKSKLPEKLVKYHSGNDTVSLFSDSRKRYLALADDGSENMTARDNNHKLTSTFEVCDWGYNHFTFKDNTNNKYLSTDNNETVRASSDDIFSWYVQQMFNIDSFYSPLFTIRAWNNSAIYLSDDNILTVHDNSLDNTNAKFRCLSQKERDNILHNFDKDSETFKKLIVENGIDEAVKIAKSSDAAIVVVGNHPLICAKEEVDRPDINLPDYQEKLIEAVFKANPNTIVVINSGYPYDISWIKDNIPAVLYSAGGCQEFGNAIADCIFGDYNPAGRLSMTWYKGIEDLPPINDYNMLNSNRTYMFYKGTPLYPFGYGLSYSDFVYSELNLDSDIISKNNKINVSFTVKNCSEYDGDEVMQMYVKINSDIKRPSKQLVDFKRIFLKAGECKEINLTLDAEDILYWNENKNDFDLEKGTVNIMIGSSSEDIRLTKQINI